MIFIRNGIILSGYDSFEDVQVIFGQFLSIPISRRNVQHRLVFLVKNGLLHAEGKARARLYTLPSKEGKYVQGRFEAYNAHAISLSPEADEIQRQVIQPIQARTPEG